jgi:hypothetical protein
MGHWRLQVIASLARGVLYSVFSNQYYEAYYTAITRILHTSHSSGAEASIGFLIGQNLLEV